MSKLTQSQSKLASFDAARTCDRLALWLVEEWGAGVGEAYGAVFGARLL